MSKNVKYNFKQKLLTQLSILPIFLCGMILKFKKNMYNI